MLARCASAVQWDSGTRVSAADKVWRAERGSSVVEVVVVVVGVYGGRSMFVVKKVLLRVKNSSGVVKDLASARRRSATSQDKERPWRIWFLSNRVSRSNN